MNKYDFDFYRRKHSKRAGVLIHRSNQFALAMNALSESDDVGLEEFFMFYLTHVCVLPHVYIYIHVPYATANHAGYTKTTQVLGLPKISESPYVSEK